MKRPQIIPQFSVGAPSVPTGLTATAVSTSQINLSWNAATDPGGPGLKDYGVYRVGTGLLAYTTNLALSDTGLTASTAYTYYVTARDTHLLESSPSGFAAATTQASGGANIIPTSPFTVTVNGGGNAANSSTLTVSRSAGTFAAKSFGSGAPQLFDTVAHQYVNGADQNAYSGFADGTDIAHLIYGEQSKDLNVGGLAMRYYTSRSMRTPFDTAVYATVNMPSSGKGCVGVPTWPAAYGAMNNQTRFVSFWARSKNAYSSDGSGGAGDDTNKFWRSTSGGSYAIPWVGNNAASRGHFDMDCSFGANTGAFTSTNGFAGAWTRWELWADLNGQIIEYFFNQAFKQVTNSNLGGIFEFCPSGSVLYAPNHPTTTAWNPSLYGRSYANLNIGLLGYDDGHGFSAGNDFDIAQVYTDPDYQRFELSDSSSWDVSPTSTVNRELQGHWSRDSSTSCTVQISQAQFASLSGKYLWYVNGRNTAEKVCQFS